MTELVLATNNPGKAREFGQLLAGLDIRVHAQADFDVPEVEETGLTFVENAILKARNAARHSGLPAIADDSGIEVDALRGAPGIYSARFAGAGASDEDNLQKLLQALQDLPEEQRSARYQCVIVYLSHADDPTPIICQGTWEGRIIGEKRGSSGFGYDPVFFDPQQNRTAAELPPADKNRISHRGKAMTCLLERLRGTVHD